MQNRIGKYITQKITGESFKAYIPTKLPPNPAIDLTKLYPALEKATIALAELNSVLKSIPNTALFIYMYVRKEALLSSQIEGTQSSFSDLMLFENQLNPSVSLEDVEEVSNYVKAITYGLERLKVDFPLSLRLLREIHAILLSGGRGSSKMPGEFRKSQNWIGGSRPGNALFVPPPPEYMNECLSDLETFLHDNSLPVLIKAGIAHVQFETIHPFLDGNGRLGRLLITLLLVYNGMLEAPILYLSLFLKQNRHTYYNLLQEVRIHGNWEVWLEFFLEGLCYCCKQALQTTLEINKLFEQDINKINSLGRLRFSAIQVFEYLKRLPQVTVPNLSLALDITQPTARSVLNKFVDLKIIAEISGKQRDKIYVYHHYLQILEKGTDPIIFRKGI